MDAKTSKHLEVLILKIVYENTNCDDDNDIILIKYIKMFSVF